MTFKGHLNERMPSIQIIIKKKESNIKNSNRNDQIDTNKRSNYESHFVKYAATLYNEVPKPMQEAAKYYAVVTKESLLS